MSTYDIMFRFQLAEAFLRKERSRVLPPLQAVGPLKHDAAERQNVSEKTKAFDAAISSVGECIVRTSPGAATALVRSEIASPAEAVALAAIKPALSSCLNAGQTFAFSPEIVRGTVALNYFRLANAGDTK